VASSKKKKKEKTTQGFLWTFRQDWNLCGAVAYVFVLASFFKHWLKNKGFVSPHAPCPLRLVSD